MSFPGTLPNSRVPDPAAAPSLRWGILGTGWIAQRFSSALRANTSQVIQAVGSRTLDSAKRAAPALGAATAHGSYEALVADPAVDVVYVATPHNFHLPHGLLALRAGKPVLIEKPIGVSADEARQLQAEASSRGLFCMEAFWTMFLPKFDVIRQLLEDDVFGGVHTVLADHGQYFDDGHRILDPGLAGGPMLDLMTYPAGFAHWVLGDPDEVVARSTWVPSGVTGQTSIMLTRGTHQHALLHSSVEGPTPTMASIGGARAKLLIDGDFYVPGGFTLTAAGGVEDGRVLRYDEPRVAHDALFWQACEVARRITAGETSSPLRTLDASIGTLGIMDAARQQTGATFPSSSAN